ncbi:hypothetical protein FW774_08655 [Pedobacter sp. BS3]|uniref:hypothetical protein n=1 Tax=Pedobacter sp. BS3 TaxID=2567937 RepID=UPI0011ED279E|nr:hypothetical protein [Pedobacter sp. BS3]TZF85025.1 hypothetical protein FW774_08655 [Pedobacter sp. BS3]
MKLTKSALLYFILSVAILACKKDEYTSRDISGLKPTPVTPEPPDPTLVVFDNAESADGWDAAGGAVLNDDKKQGDHSVKATIAGGDALRMQKALATSINPNITKENGQLIFWLYVEDASRVKLSDGQIEITSSGQPDQQEYNWPTSSLGTLQTGWNKIQLDLKDAGESGGGADLGAINFFRIYMNTTDAASATAPFTMAIDAVGFVQIGGSGGGPVDTGIWESCDNLDGWDSPGNMGDYIETAGKKEGTGFIKGKIPIGSNEMRFAKLNATSFDSKVTKENGQLTFWFYVEHPELFSEIQVQISSTDNIDSYRYGWNLMDEPATGVKLNTGWNEIKLDLTRAYDSDGGADLSALRFFRIFGFTNDNATAEIPLAIDGIKFLKKPAPAPSLWESCDNLDGWDIPGNMAAFIETAGKKEGSGFIKGKIPVGDDYMRFAKQYASTFDTKVTKDNGQLAFWFYVEQPELFNEIQVQVSSTDNIDSYRYGWNLMDEPATGVKLKTGWNEIKLDLTRSYDSDGGADLSAVKYFRIFGITKDKVTAEIPVGIDGIKFQQK